MSLLNGFTGALYLDTNAIIYLVEPGGSRHDKARVLFQELIASKVQLVTSKISILECLTHPTRQKNEQVVIGFNSFFERLDTLYLSEVSENSLLRAIDIAAHNGLKTVDAIHAATAITSGCDAILTNDRGFQRLDQIKVLIFDDLEA